MAQKYKKPRKVGFFMCMNPIKIKTPMTNLRIFNYDLQEQIEVPCGKCEECRISHANMWAVRIMCELYSRSKEEQERTWFLTLTYDDFHNPGVLIPDHVTRFIKKLRNDHRDIKIKYFYCGEYGTTTLRPHYHMIIYNLPLEDIVKSSKNLFSSEYLENIWGRGMVKIGFVTLQSAAYVAKYALKKNETDCFIRMSYGFGKNYFLKKMNYLISMNSIPLPVNKSSYNPRGIAYFSIPRYFLKIYRSIVGDREYEKFIRFRISQKRARENLIEDHFKSEEDKFDYLTRQRLGRRSAAFIRLHKNRVIVSESKRRLELIRDFDI